MVRREARDLGEPFERQLFAKVLIDVVEHAVDPRDVLALLWIVVVGLQLVHWRASFAMEGTLGLLWRSRACAHVGRGVGIDVVTRGRELAAARALARQTRLAMISPRAEQA